MVGTRSCDSTSDTGQIVPDDSSAAPVSAKSRSRNLKEKSDPTADNVSKRSRKNPSTSFSVISSSCTREVVPTGQTGSTWQPDHWKEHLENIRVMRQNADAPVDAIGAECLMDKKAPEKDQRYQILLSLMLSSRTKDEVTAGAMSRLIAYGCTVENIMATEETKLAQLIKPVGFYNTKAKSIKRATEIIHSRYDSDVPKTLAEITSLPGVGAKMGLLTLQIAWNITEGIAVDTHVHRICNRLGWVRKQTKDPSDTQKAIEDWIPRGHWHEINKLLVGFGQTICVAQSPHCGSCLNQKLCPVGRKYRDI